MEDRNKLARIVVFRAALALLGLTLTAVPAVATDITLFSNGPATSIDSTAWDIDGPSHFVSDSFYIGASSTITGFSFDVWVDKTTVPTQFDWAVGVVPFNETIGLGTATSFGLNKENWTQINAICPSGTCDVYTVTVSGLNLSVPIGTYWLTLLSGASTGAFIGWDQNSGAGCTGWNNTLQGCPSQAFNTDTAHPIPSEDPDIIGRNGSPCSYGDLWATRPDFEFELRLIDDASGQIMKPSYCFKWEWRGSIRPSIYMIDKITLQ